MHPNGSPNPYAPPTTIAQSRRTSWLGYLVSFVLGLIGIFFCAVIGLFLGMGVAALGSNLETMSDVELFGDNFNRGAAMGFWSGAALGVVRVVVLMYHKVRRDSVREVEAEV